MVRVAVVGGGVTGLAAAYHLSTAGVDVALYESAPTLGGKLRTTPFAGLPTEEGADAFLTVVPEAVALATAAGAELVHPRSASAQVYAAGRIRTLPPGTLLGVPGSARGLGGVLSVRGRARATLDLLLPRTGFAGDPTVGVLVRRRLGAEVLDRLVDPLLGGVYAGSADSLSLRATLPALAVPERSLLRTVAARRSAGGRTGPVFASTAGGTRTLVTALAGVIRDRGALLECATTVTGLERDGAKWALLVGAAGRQRRELADAVVLAVPARPAGRLLDGLVPGGALPATPYASVAIVALAYSPHTAVPPGNGFLVAASERRTIKAITFVGAKWNHDADAPVVIRASIGRYGTERDLQRPDVELAGLAAAEVGALAGVTGRPISSRVSRWGGGLPQYLPGHLDRVTALRTALPAGIAVGGAGYDGVGIPACVRSGTAAAAAALDQLGG